MGRRAESVRKGRGQGGGRSLSEGAVPGEGRSLDEEAVHRDWTRAGGTGRSYCRWAEVGTA